MDVRESRNVQFEQYIEWRLENFNKLVKTSTFSNCGIDFQLKIFTDDISREDCMVVDWSPVTNFLADIEETDFIVQVFTDQKGFDFGKITLWNNPMINIRCAENLTIKKLLLLEYGFETEFQYHIIVAI